MVGDWGGRRVWPQPVDIFSDHEAESCQQNQM